MPNVSCMDDVFGTMREQLDDAQDPWVRRSLADFDTARSSRSLLRLGSIVEDMDSWKHRANESVRQAGERTMQLQEKLEMKDKSLQATPGSSIFHDVETEPIPEEECERASVVPVVSHSGWLIKRAHRTLAFKRRLFCLMGRELVYHKSLESSTVACSISGRVNLDLDTVLQPVPNHGFKLIQGSSTMLLYALNDADRDCWIKKLQQCGAVVNLVPTEAKSMADNVITSGWLRKQGQIFKSLKRRWFELTGVGLKYYQNPEATRAKGFLPIGRNSVVTRLDIRKTGERFSFSITENALEKKSRVLIMHADSQEDRSIWVAALASVIDGLEPIEASMRMPLDITCMERSMSEETETSSPTHESPGHEHSLREEDLVRDITREAQLILISPYSPEGTTSENFLKTIHRKTLSVDSIRRFMEGLMEYMVQTRMDYFKSIYGDSDNAFDTIAQMISEQVEERVFSPVHKAVYQSLATRQDSKALQDRLELLRGRKQAYFGIQPPSPSGYAAAIQAMNAIDTQSLPSLKRKQLVTACKTIYTVAANEQLYPTAMSADDFIPAFIYVVVQCSLEDVLALKELLVAFPPVSASGEMAYFVTCLEIAIEYIQSLVILQETELDANLPLGVTIIRHDHGGMVVKQVEPGSQAAACGAIHAGDVLVAVNGVSVHDRSVADVKKMLDATAGPIALAFVCVKDYKRIKATFVREIPA
ncbi:unnamed protein product [Aphanomyces euteiches]